MPFLNKTVPEYIVDVVFSDEYIDFLLKIRDEFSLSEEQMAALDTIITSLFEKTLQPTNLTAELKRKFIFDDEKIKEFARQIFLNIVLVFGAYFGDFLEKYQKEFGRDPNNDLPSSHIFLRMMRDINTTIKIKADEILSMNWEQQAKDMLELFEKNLAEHFFAPDGPYKISLNNTIFALFHVFDDYHVKLLDALYKNEQDIGDRMLEFFDGSKQKPTIANWIKDFLAFVEGVVSSIGIAKYLSENVNAKTLDDTNKEAIRRLLETFSVLKNFPESFEKMTLDTWMVIPYHLPDEGVSKIPRQVGQEPMAKAALPLTEQGTGAAPNTTTAQPVEPLKKVDIKIDISAVVDAVIVNAGVIFSNEALERVKKIIETRVRNVRNDIDTRERLIAAVAEGGAGIVAEGAEKMLAEVKKAQQFIADGPASAASYGAVQYASNGAVEKGSGTNSRVREIEPDPKEPDTIPTITPPKMVIKEVGGVPMIVEKKKTNGIEKGAGTNSGDWGQAQIREYAKLSQTPIEPAKMVSGTISEEIEPDTILSQLPTDKKALPIAVPQHLEGAQVIPVVVQQSGAETGAGTNSRVREIESDQNAKLSQKSFLKIGAEKKPIPDVKAMPRLVTVIDELRALTIKDMRRISQNTGAACQKIIEKINALSKESLSKRAEAINAWKESPAYALYIEIGQLNIGQDMAKIAEERKTAGKEHLTEEEFDALLELNGKLRF